MSELPRPGPAAEILLVEDSPTQAEQLRLLLQRHGYKVMVGRNGREALALLDSRLPALIISDVVMPEMDGYQLCRKIKGDPRCRPVPMILLTALTDPIEVLNGLECGADSFITKPYRPEYLLERIAQFLASTGRAPPPEGPGEEIWFHGERHVITVGRRQAIDLLLASYEIAVQKNQELLEAEERLEELNQGLEARVTERTLDLRKEIARRESAEQMLREKLAEIEQIYRYAPVGLFFLNRDCRLVRLNEQMAALSGLPLAAHVGRSLQEVLPGIAERLVALTVEVFARSEPLLGVEIHGTPGRQAAVARDLLCNLIPFKATHEVAGIIGAVLDITERKHAEAALQRVNEELRQTLRELRNSQEQVVQAEKMAAVGTMVAGVVHELNNPLMGVMGYLEHARSHPDDPSLGDVLGRARDELERMGELLRGMLSFSRPADRGQRETSVPQLIERVVGLMGADFRARGILLEVNAEPHLPPIQSRPERLQQVFMNLLLNARDAVKESSRKSVTIRAWCTAGDVWVEFADTGHGIPAALRERIFEPFFTTKPPGEGTGMGLAVSRDLIAELAGELTFESEEGKGARFRVRLAAAPGTRCPAEGDGAA